jgi:hypothetical protein
MEGIKVEWNDDVNFKDIMNRFISLNFIVSDDKLYRWNGSLWIACIENDIKLSDNILLSFNFPVFTSE